MNDSELRWLCHVGGVLNAYLALQSLDRGGWWLLAGTGHVLALLSIARSLARLDQREKRNDHAND